MNLVSGLALSPAAVNESAELLSYQTGEMPVVAWSVPLESPKNQICCLSAVSLPDSQKALRLLALL